MTSTATTRTTTHRTADRPASGARTSRQRSLLRALGALAAAAAIAATGMLGAGAIPPDGPGPESPGTSSRVWPTQVQVGDLLYFEVSGYPPNETLYIKIDDGLMCSDTSHGACVYATQAIDSNGYASGSIVVPDIPAGAHWLRMLATGDQYDARTGEVIGYLGYTRRGGNDFTVVAASGGGGTSSDSGSGSGQSGSGSGGSGSAAAAGSSDSGLAGGAGSTGETGVEGGSVTIDAGAEDESAEGEDSESGEESTPDLITVDPETSPEPEATADTGAAGGGSHLPVVGIAALGGAVVLGSAGVGWAFLHRRRLADASAASVDDKE